MAQKVQTIKAEISYDPFQKQREFHLDQTKYKLYAGGFGSGKTFALVYEIISHAVAFPGIRILLGRKTEDELLKTTLMEFFEMCPSQILAGGHKDKAWNKARREILFINGSVLLYMPMDVSKGALDKVGKAINLAIIITDELSELSDTLFDVMTSRLRQAPKMINGKKIIYPHRIFGATNPSGHDWVWKRFASEGRDRKYYSCHTTKTCDNPHLPPDYERILRETHTPRWSARYLDASWDDFSGLIFPEFKEKTHVVDSIPYEGVDYKNIPELETAIGCKGLKFRAIDYGYSNPTVCLWKWVFPKVMNRKGEWDERAGEVYIYKEHYQSHQTVDFHARMILESSLGETIEITVIDPSAFNTNPDGKSVGDEFIRHELSVFPAKNMVEAGLNRVRERLTISDITGRAKLYVMSNCVHTIEEFGTYKLKELKAGDERNTPEEPMKKDDHCMDALRYGCMWLYENRGKIDNYANENELLRRERNKMLGLDPNADFGMWGEVFDNKAKYADAEGW